MIIPNKYAKTSLKAIRNYQEPCDIVEMYLRAAHEVFTTKSSQVKGCTKGTFLGLCEEGLVKGIPKGNYTKTIEIVKRIRAKHSHL